MCLISLSPRQLGRAKGIQLSPVWLALLVSEYEVEAKGSALGHGSREGSRGLNVIPLTTF